METKEKAVAVLSGGLDSSVAMSMAMTESWEVSLALTFRYGQRAASKEVEHAKAIASHFRVPHRVLDLPWFSTFGQAGSLLNASPLPSPSLNQLDEAEFTQASARQVWVPNRNGVFLEIAAGIAEDQGGVGVVVGFNAEEAATFPDNSLDYLRAISKALSFSTSTHVRVISPTAVFRKTDIVKKALALDFPLSLLWSCYESRERMCGSCESCMRLKRALSENGIGLEDRFENTSL